MTSIRLSPSDASRAMPSMCTVVIGFLLQGEIYGHGKQDPGNLVPFWPLAELNSRCRLLLPSVTRRHKKHLRCQSLFSGRPFTGAEPLSVGTLKSRAALKDAFSWHQRLVVLSTLVESSTCLSRSGIS